MNGVKKLTECGKIPLTFSDGYPTSRFMLAQCLPLGKGDKFKSRFKGKSRDKSKGSSAPNSPNPLRSRGKFGSIPSVVCFADCPANASEQGVAYRAAHTNSRAPQSSQLQTAH